jgi:hypothetical protein
MATEVRAALDQAAKDKMKPCNERTQEEEKAIQDTTGGE